jgi:hypothetical protein
MRKVRHKKENKKKTNKVMRIKIVGSNYNILKKREPRFVWFKEIYCNACGQVKPTLGFEYYFGNLWRCPDCRREGIPLPAYYHAVLEGVIGETIPAFGLLEGDRLWINEV